MKIKELLEKLTGIQTIETIMDIINIDRQKAIYFIHRLKKSGYVKTKRLSNNKRVYAISFENRFRGTSYYEIINKYSPLKIAIPEIYKVYGKELSLESTLIYAIKTQSLRTILASLALFKKIDDWSKLYQLAKKNHIERQVGALYDIAREIMLTRRMTKRFRNNSLPKEDYQWRYIVLGIKSDDFKYVEKKWKIYIPFNKKDLEVYKK
jgi:DNA-binding Lrp family transcriptional regulator